MAKQRRSNTWATSLRGYPQMADVNTGFAFPTRIILEMSDEAGNLLAFIPDSSLANQDVQLGGRNKDVSCQRSGLQARRSAAASNDARSASMPRIADPSSGRAARIETSSRRSLILRPE